MTKTMTQKGSAWSLLSVALILLVLDRQWGFVFTNTVFASQPMVYASFLLLLFLFLWLMKKYGGKWNSINLIWLPFILSTILGYLFIFKLQHITYWMICLIIMMTAGRTDILNSIPVKLLYYSGLFALLGIAVQIFLPNIYSSYISPLFIMSDDRMEIWAEGFGFNGFTYQLGQTASILLYCEVVLLYMKDRVLNVFLRKKFSYYLLLGLIIVSIFLTGKRTLAALALILPFFVFFVSSKRHSLYKILIVILVFVVVEVAYQYFISNVYLFTDSLLLRRFANSYIEMNAGGDIYSGRQELYDIAFKAFKDSPFWGIGVGRFREYTGSETQVHNTYLQVLCEQGLVGFVIYIIPIIFCFIRSVSLLSITKEKKLLDYLKLSLSIQMIYLVCAITGNENIGSGFVFYFIAMGIIIHIENYVKKEKFTTYDKNSSYNY